MQWSKDQVYDGDAGLNLVAAEAIDAATGRYSFLIEGLEEGIPQFVRVLASNRVGYSAPQRAVPLGTNLEVQAIVLKESDAALIDQVNFEIHLCIYTRCNVVPVASVSLTLAHACVDNFSCLRECSHHLPPPPRPPPTLCLISHFRTCLFFCIVPPVASGAQPRRHGQLQPDSPRS